MSSCRTNYNIFYLSTCLTTSNIFYLSTCLNSTCPAAVQTTTYSTCLPALLTPTPAYFSTSSIYLLQILVIYLFYLASTIIASKLLGKIINLFIYLNLSNLQYVLMLVHQNWGNNHSSASINQHQIISDFCSCNQGVPTNFTMCVCWCATLHIV